MKKSRNNSFKKSEDYVFFYEGIKEDIEFMEENLNVLLKKVKENQKKEVEDCIKECFKLRQFFTEFDKKFGKLARDILFKEN